MTQVFAAINHRLSEEYANIDLPSIEAKERYVVLIPTSVLCCLSSRSYMFPRMLADARFLHEKLSALKNVRAPTAMLEIVIQEKRVNAPQTQSPQSINQSISMQSSVPPASTTTSRFAHMFSRAAPSRTNSTTAPASSPVPAPDSEFLSAVSPTPDVEKELPILSPSPEPSSQGVTPTPSVPLKTPELANGHASPQSPQPSQVLNDAADKTEPEGDEPEDADDVPDSEPTDVATEVEAPPPPPKDALEAEGALLNGINGEASVSSPSEVAAEKEVNGVHEEDGDVHEVDGRPSAVSV